jgi:hypothetical protein
MRDSQRVRMRKRGGAGVRSLASRAAASSSSGPYSPSVPRARPGAVAWRNTGCAGQAGGPAPVCRRGVPSRFGGARSAGYRSGACAIPRDPGVGSRGVVAGLHQGVFVGLDDPAVKIDGLVPAGFRMAPLALHVAFRSLAGRERPGAGKGLHSRKIGGVDFHPLPTGAIFYPDHSCGLPELLRKAHPQSATYGASLQQKMRKMTRIRAKNAGSTRMAAKTGGSRNGRP